MSTQEYQDFLELVRSSRSFRRFDEARAVSQEELRALVEAARLAPTGNNSQLLRFRLCWESDDVATCLAHHRWAALLRDWDGPAEGERPTAYVAVCGPRGAGRNAIRNIDAGIAAQTIMLAARTMGLGGCMIRSFDPGINDGLGLSGKGYECLVLLALGSPAEDVVLEPAGGEHGVAYWREPDGSHHVPKRSVDELLI